MKYKFFDNNENKLIIFFNGWGMDDKIVSHLDMTGYDLVILYDYNDLELTLPTLKKYEQTFVVGWSMGVMISTLFDFEGKRIAINGTPKSVDNDFGIPERVYKLTIRGFSEESCEKFMQRMFDKKPPIEKFSTRDFSSQKQELIALLEVQGKEVEFDKIIVSDNDLIIPTKNQLAYWKNAEIIKSGHCPFFEYQSWEQIL